MKLNKEQIVEAMANAIGQELFNSHKPDRRPIAECAKELAEAALSALARELPQSEGKDVLTLVCNGNELYGEIKSWAKD